MRIFKNREFNQWACKQGISDTVLQTAVKEIELGLFDANLGGYVLKKRVTIGNKGKRGGARVLLAYSFANKVFFIYGFAKNAQANINRHELYALKHLAKELMSYDDIALAAAIKSGALIEVKR